MRRATRADVAREAGVSVTVVSYVMNNNRYVDSEKRRRVLDAVEKLHYVPSASARALAGKGTQNILLITSDISSPHFSALVREFEKVSAKEGYSVALCQYREDDPSFISSIINRAYDGIIIGSTAIDSKDINALIDADFPVVILEMKSFEGLVGVYGVISTGLYEGTLDAMKALKERGRKKIAFVSSVDHTLHERDYRYAAYMASVENAPLVIKGASSHQELAEKLALTWKEEGFDGLLCRSDVIAAVAVKTLSELGVEVPEEVSVIGFDDTLISRLTSPALSSIRIKRDEIAKNALSMIKEINQGNLSAPVRVQLTTELVTRNSI